MNDAQIRSVLRGFIDEIFAPITVAETREITRRLHDFIKQEHVTDEQLEEFTASGAGETLYMVASMTHED